MLISLPEAVLLCFCLTVLFAAPVHTTGCGKNDPHKVDKVVNAAQSYYGAKQFTVEWHPPDTNRTGYFYLLRIASNKEETVSQTNKMFYNLNLSAEYNVSIRTGLKGCSESDPVTILCRTRPNVLKSNVIITEVTQTSFKASWTASKDVGVAYQTSCSAGIVNQTFARCSELPSGANVSFGVRTVKVGVPDDAGSFYDAYGWVLTKLFGVEQNSPKFTASETAISVSWSASNTSNVTYEVTCSGPGCNKPKLTGVKTNVTFSSLQSGEAYSFKITVKKSGGFDDVATDLGIQLTKLFAVEKQSIEIFTSSTFMTASWNKSQTADVTYLLNCNSLVGSGLSEETSDRNSSCTELLPGRSYNVSLTVKKSGGFEDAITELGILETKETPSSRVRNLQANAVTAESATVEFEEPEMKNGVVLAYGIQIAEQNFTRSPCSLMVLNVSSESCQLANCSKINELIDELANGCEKRIIWVSSQSIRFDQDSRQLNESIIRIRIELSKAQTEYNVRVTPISQTVLGEAAEQTFRTLASSNNWWLLIGVPVGVGVVVLLLPAVVLALFVLRRRHHREKNYSGQGGDLNVQFRTDFIVPVRVPVRTLEIGSSGFKANTSDENTNGTIVSEFTDYASEMLANTSTKSDSQFEKLKTKAQDATSGLPTSAGSDPVNRDKNRYTNIVPFDANRVCLNSSDHQSDYINASYVNGLSGDKETREFIVTQGPKSSTIEDHWRLVWEQSVRLIVMLTECVEKNKVKCEQYWPDEVGERLFLEQLEVELDGVKRSDSWVAREITLWKIGDNGAALSLQVTHLQYTTWDDYAVPNLDELAEFVNCMRLIRVHQEKEGDSCGPILVHCSAGVGRTGTFIALDMLARRLQNAGGDSWISVFDTVLELRLCRMEMVQTKRQYSFIYSFLLNYLKKKKRLTYAACEPDEIGGPADPVYVSSKDYAAL